VRAEQRLVAGATPRRTRARAASGVAALTLVALVAALSAGLPGRISGGGADLSAQALLGDAAAVVLVLALAALAYMAYGEWAGRERRRPARRGRRRRPRLPRPRLDPRVLVVPLLLAAAAALLLAIVALLGGSDGHARLGGPLPAPAAGVRLPTPPARGGGSVPLDPAVLIAAAALVAIAGAWFGVRARRQRPASDDGGEQHALVAAVDDSLDDLAREADPRRAVIKAYDRMERALAAGGAPRARAETPLEYLRRALAAVRASQSSIRRLTDLFEQARFSTHTIDAAMKHEAISALTALRAELDGSGAT
jgi:hypothetical protein